MQTCEGKTKTGKACRAPAGAGGLCFFHANPDCARNFGRIGGRKNRRLAVDLQVPDNISAADLRNVQVQAIRLLVSGEMHAREASALAQLCNSLCRVIPTADLEARVNILEEQAAREENEPSPCLESSQSPTKGAEATQSDARLEAAQYDPPSANADATTQALHENGGRVSENSHEAEEVE